MKPDKLQTPGGGNPAAEKPPEAPPTPPTEKPPEPSAEPAKPAEPEPKKPLGADKPRRGRPPKLQTPPKRPRGRPAKEIEAAPAKVYKRPTDEEVKQLAEAVYTLMAPLYGVKTPAGEPLSEDQRKALAATASMAWARVIVMETSTAESVREMVWLEAGMLTLPAAVFRIKDFLAKRSGKPPKTPPAPAESPTGK